MKKDSNKIFKNGIYWASLFYVLFILVPNTYISISRFWEIIGILLGSGLGIFFAAYLADSGGEKERLIERISELQDRLDRTK